MNYFPCNVCERRGEYMYVNICMCTCVKQGLKWSLYQSLYYSHCVELFSLDNRILSKWTNFNLWLRKMCLVGLNIIYAYKWHASPFGERISLNAYDDSVSGVCCSTAVPARGGDILTRSGVRLGIICTYIIYLFTIYYTYVHIYTSKIYIYIYIKKRKTHLIHSVLFTRSKFLAIVFR